MNEFHVEHRGFSIALWNYQRAQRVVDGIIGTWFYLPWKVHANIPPKAYGWQVVLTRYIGLHSLATFYLQMCPIAPLQFGVTTWFLLVVPHFRHYQRAKLAAISLPRPKPFGWVNHAKSPSYSLISLCLVARSLVLAGKYPMFHRSTISGGS